MVIGVVDLDDLVDVIDVRQTLRIQWFGQQIASEEVSPEGKNQPQTVIFKWFENARKSCLERDFGSSRRHENY